MSIRIPFVDRVPRRARVVLEVLAWSAFFAFALVFLGMRYWLLPNIERYRGDIVAAISQAVGLPVTIGAIATDWQGLRPRIAIADVRVYDRDGREALVLPAVENVISWRSLAVLRLRLHSFVIDAPRLAVRRDREGRIFVAGLATGGGPGDGRLADWILRQNEIVVRGAEVEWLDEARGAPVLRLSALNFRLVNDGDEHRVGLSARPPRDLGPGLELRAQLKGDDPAELSRWTGQVYAELGYTDLAGWRAWVDYPLDVRRGEGALRVWATLEGGRVSRSTADVALEKVVARLAPELPVLEISSVRGRVFGRETPRGYDFGVRGLALARPGAPAMNGTSFRATWEPASSANLAQRGSVSANLIELAPLAHLAEYLPFPPGLRAMLADLAPQGNLLDARFDWTGELPDKATFSAKTRFAGLAMKAWGSVPGFTGLSGTVDATEKKGTLYLASRKSELELPRVFPEPRMAFETLNGEIAWERGAGAAPALSVRLANLSLANDDFAGTAFGTYAWTGEGPGVVDLSAQLSRVDGRRTQKYLPLASIMGPATREWVATSVLAGQASDVRLRLKGDLRDFPFADPAKGQFQLAAKVSGAVLDYAQGWPRIEAIEGDLNFEREKIQVAGRSASILGARLSGVRVLVPSMLEERTRVVIEGAAEGPTADFLRYVRESPVRRMTGGFTDGMAAAGRGKLRLKLELPLDDLSRSKIAGEYQFAANTVTVDPRLPPVERAAGRVSFSESALGVHDVRGQLFGGEVRIAGGTRPDGAIVVQADGRATVEGMRTLFDHPWRRRLAGAARYGAAVTVRDGRTQITFDTTLEGVSSTLPAPLAKIAAEPLPLRLEVLPGEGRDRISVLLGAPQARVLAAEFLRAAPPGAAPGAPLEVQRTLISFNPEPGETARIPERRGTTVRGRLAVLDLDRWLPLLGEGPGTGDGASFDLRIGVLDALGKRMRQVAMLGVTEPIGWSANVTTAEFAGDITYRGEGNGRLIARFQRFMLPEDAPGAAPGEAAKRLPAVDIVANSFTHRGRRLGRVEIQARHEGRDWRIDRLAMVNPDSSLSGSGLWKHGEGSRTSVAFKLEVADVGAFLERIGYPDHVKGGRAKLEGSLGWNGDPVTVDYATLGGNLAMQAEDGQFLEIEPGIGKLVALMSLQMLPRRVTLDFRDVFSKGFKWDKIASSMTIERGVMAVKEFHMNGPAADVFMTGRIDMGLETQALEVKVIPQLGDSASTVVGLVNPVAGVATLLAGRIFKNPLGKLFAFDYRITGTWTDPKVEKLEPPKPPPTVIEGSGVQINPQ